jgi:hypothetical protein
VWPQRSCSPTVVVYQQSTKPLTTAYWSVGSRVWAISQKQHHIALALIGDAGAQLDARARAAYTQRLEDLQAILDEAERFSDPARAATARAEIDFLTAELATAGKCSSDPVSSPSPSPTLPALHPSLWTRSLRTLVQVVPAHSAFATAQVAMQPQK